MDYARRDKILLDMNLRAFVHSKARESLRRPYKLRHQFRIFPDFIAISDSNKIGRSVPSGNHSTRRSTW